MQLFTASTTPTQPLGLLPLANQIISQSVQYHRLISLFCHHPVTTPLHVLLVLNTGIAHHNDHPNVDPPSLNQDNDNQINTDRVNVDPSLANPGTNAIIDPLYYLYLVAVPTPVPPLVSVPVLVLRL
ncbi:hypothetical protein KEM48_008248 [Puccinia striiformis f. sp. tritici PST-130]|nr:hypothetical protein KEM48_008248 [Puccinia striiformis f. sp. tritici PST-130]